MDGKCQRNLGGGKTRVRVLEGSGMANGRASEGRPELLLWPAFEANLARRGVGSRQAPHWVRSARQGLDSGAGEPTVFLDRLRRRHRI